MWQCIVKKGCSWQPFWPWTIDGDCHGWSIQPNRAAHNPAARWCAAGLCVGCVGGHPYGWSTQPYTASPSRRVVCSSGLSCRVVCSSGVCCRVVCSSGVCCRVVCSSGVCCRVMCKSGVCCRVVCRSVSLCRGSPVIVLMISQDGNFARNSCENTQNYCFILIRQNFWNFVIIGMWCLSFKTA